MSNPFDPGAQQRLAIVPHDLGDQRLTGEP